MSSNVVAMPWCTTQTQTHTHTHRHRHTDTQTHTRTDTHTHTHKGMHTQLCERDEIMGWRDLQPHTAVMAHFDRGNGGDGVACPHNDVILIVLEQSLTPWRNAAEQRKKKGRRNSGCEQQQNDAHLRLLRKNTRSLNNTASKTHLPDGICLCKVSLEDAQTKSAVDDIKKQEGGLLGGGKSLFLLQQCLCHHCGTVAPSIADGSQATRK